LLIYSGWLGDLVWLLPAIRALSTAYDSVSLVVSEVQAGLAAIIEGDLVEKVYVDTNKHRLRSARSVRKAALANDTGTFIDLKGRWKTGIYIPWRHGVRAFLPYARDAREYALAKLLHPFAATMPARDTSGHMVEAYLSALRGLGAEDTPISFDLEFDDGTKEQAESIIAREGLRSARSVVLNIGSAQRSKIWPAENFRRLAEALEGDLQCKVVIMGAQSFSQNNNYDVVASRQHFSDGRFTNLVEATDLAVDCCLLRSGVFDVAVGNDSFAGHMAGSANEISAADPGAVQAANGKHYRANRTVSLFGPTNPRFCRPYDPTDAFNTIVMPDSYPDDCPYNRKDHTCPHYGDAYCVERNHCMNSITVEKVVGAVEDSLC
jgi:ADP-heptose:LPS heptosyltransferase